MEGLWVRSLRLSNPVSIATVRRVDGSPGPAIWRVGDRSQVYVMGTAPPGVQPWQAGPIEALVCSSSEFWAETPEPGPEAQALGLQYGVSAAKPLADWLDPDLLARVEALGESLEAPAPIIQVVRPWLACQLLQMAAAQQWATPPANGADSVLRGIAHHAGISVQHEFPTLEAVIQTFAGLSPAAEVQYLRLYVAELEAGPSTAAERHRRWREGDLPEEIAYAEHVAANYPDFAEELVFARNRAWVPRIREMLERPGRRAFLLPGLGHLLGPGNLIQLLQDAGLRPERL